MSKNKELKKHNEELRIEIKACEKIQNEQGKELMKVNEETDFYYKIKSLSEELRMQKQRNKESSEKAAAEKDKNSKYKDKIRSLEQKIKKLTSEGTEDTPNKSKEAKFMSARIEDLEITNESLQRKLDTANKRMKNTKIVMGNEAKGCRQDLERLEILYRDKDKECRLLTLKLKELQRIGKFPRLKPLDLDLVSSDIGNNRAKSTMRNQEQEIFNPRLDFNSGKVNNEAGIGTDRPKKTKLLPSKIYNVQKNNISIHTDTEAADRSIVIKPTKQKALPQIKTDSITRNKNHLKEVSSTEPFKRPRADSIESDEDKKKQVVEEKVVEEKVVEEKVVKRITKPETPKAREKSPEEVVKPVSIAKPKEKKRIDIKKLTQKLISNKPSQENIETEELESKLEKVEEVKTSQVKAEQIKEAIPEAKQHKVEQTKEVSDEELESEEEESEEEIENPTSKFESGLIHLDHQMNTPKVIETEAQDNELANKIFNSNKEEDKDEIQHIETYKSTNSNRLAVNSAAEGYVDEIIQKVSDVESISLKQKKSASEIQAEVIKSIQSMISTKVQAKETEVNNSKIENAKAHESDSGESEEEESEEETEKASFKDYKE